MFHHPKSAHIMGRDIFSSKLGNHPSESLVRMSLCILL